MKKIILLLPFCIFLAACKNEAPNCSNKETVKLIKQIARDELKKVGIDAIKMKMQVTNIRTLTKNINTGTYSCAANFNLTVNLYYIPILISYNTTLVESDRLL